MLAALAVVAGSLAFVAAPATPAGALQAGVTDSRGLSGACNMMMHGLADGLWTQGYKQDILCNAVVPVDATVGGFANVPFPHGDDDWSPDSIGPTAVGGCDINGGDGGPYFGRGYSGGNWTEGCGTQTNMYDFQSLQYLQLGEPFTYNGNTYKAVQIRIMFWRVPAEGVTNPGRVWSNDTTEAQRLTARDQLSCTGNQYGACLFSLGIQRAGGAKEVRNMGFGGFVANEGMSENTSPPVPTLFFTGGSDQYLGACAKYAWTGPAENTEYKSGVEYTFQVEYNSADTIKWAWNDGILDPAWIDIPATGSPQTLRVVARATGEWLPTIHCVKDGEEFTWGNYVNIDAQELPGGEAQLVECFDGTGIGLNPASWVPAAGRVGACMLRVLFVPTVTPLDSIQATYEDKFPASLVTDLVGMVTTTLDAAQDGLESAACPHIDFSSLAPSQLGAFDELDVRAPTPTGSGCAGAGGVAGDVGGYRNWLRTGSRFGLWFLVMLGLSRRVGPKDGPVMVKP